MGVGPTPNEWFRSTAIEEQLRAAPGVSCSVGELLGGASGGSFWGELLGGASGGGEFPGGACRGVISL